MDIDAIRHQLDESRAALLAALEGLSESDFNTELEPGGTVIAALVDLARSERAAIARARETVGAPPRPRLAGHGAPARRFTPPPVVHDLAGARYETGLLLETLARRELPLNDAVLSATSAILTAVASGERRTAERIRGRLPEASR